jgi:hypothetical protein
LFVGASSHTPCSAPVTLVQVPLSTLAVRSIISQAHLLPLPSKLSPVIWAQGNFLLQPFLLCLLLYCTKLWLDIDVLLRPRIVAVPPAPHTVPLRRCGPFRRDGHGMQEVRCMRTLLPPLLLPLLLLRCPSCSSFHIVLRLFTPPPPLFLFYPALTPEALPPISVSPCTSLLLARACHTRITLLQVSAV